MSGVKVAKFNVSVHPGRWVNLLELPNGDLQLQPTPEIDEADFDELEKLPTDDALHELLEDHIMGGDCYWISPETIGALTDAPILSFDPPDTAKKVYWHERYAVEDPIQTLRDHQAVVFKGSNSEEEMTTASSNKVALDALLEELNNPFTTVDPRNDKEYNHPFGSKGTEPEDVKYGSKVASFLRIEDMKAIGRGEKSAQEVMAGQMLCVGGIPLTEWIKAEKNASQITTGTNRDKASLIVDMVSPVLEKYSKMYGSMDTAVRDNIFSICYNALKNNRMPSHFTKDTLALYDKPKADVAAHEIGVEVLRAMHAVTKMAGWQTGKKAEEVAPAPDEYDRVMALPDPEKEQWLLAHGWAKDEEWHGATWWLGKQHYYKIDHEEDIPLKELDDAVHTELERGMNDDGSPKTAAHPKTPEVAAGAMRGFEDSVNEGDHTDDIYEFLDYLKTEYRANVPEELYDELVDAAVKLYKGRTKTGASRMDKLNARLDPRHTKEEVNFESPAKGMDNCQSCKFFNGKDGCSEVQGLITAGAWCKEFKLAPTAKSASAECVCGHAMDIHIHPPDFGCPHEKDGCGCKGATEKKNARSIMHDDSGATTGLRSHPDYGESDSYTSKMNDANSKGASVAYIELGINHLRQAADASMIASIKTASQAYNYLVTVQEGVIAKAHKVGHKEVGEVDETTLRKWCETRWPKIALIKQHGDPTLKPQRDDLRRHIDRDVRDERNDSLGKTKEWEANTEDQHHATVKMQSGLFDEPEGMTEDQRRDWYLARSRPDPNFDKATSNAYPFVDLSDPQWRYEERVQRLVNRGSTREEAEQVVKNVIMTKEMAPKMGSALFVTADYDDADFMMDEQSDVHHQQVRDLERRLKSLFYADTDIQAEAVHQQMSMDEMWAEEGANWSNEYYNASNGHVAASTTDWSKPHCENCGRQNPERNDGYTDCCNELMCSGVNPNQPFFKGYRFGTPEVNVRACCWAHAEEIFEKKGIKVPEGSSQLPN